MTVSPDTLRAVYDAMPVGIVLLDGDSKVVFYNRYEEKLAGRNRESVLGQPFFEKVAPCTEAVALGEHFREQLAGGKPPREIMFRFPRPHLLQPRDVRLVLSSVEHGDRRLGLLCVQDISMVRAVERTKDFLIRAMAHDASSPLTVLSGSFDLARCARTPSELDASLDDGIDALNQLARMVKNLHDVTMLETGAVPVAREVADVRSIGAEAVESCRAAADRRGIELVLTLPDQPADAEVDRELTRRAVTNLIDNALRYAPRGGRVETRVSGAADHIEIEVRDNGPGVPPDLRAKIFKPFQQGPGPQFVDINDKARHRGLGLAFVDLVAREHGGQVVLHSPEEGGAVFTLCVPTRA